MIKDATRLAELQEKWRAVRRLCERSQRSWQSSGPYIVEATTPAGPYFNLPFVLAYAVLDDALDQLIFDKVFCLPPKCKRKPSLGTKMHASKNHLGWRNYALVEAGKCARNRVAHEAMLATEEDCFRYIEAIEAELKAWNIVN